eukprot:SAG31_NODE_3727_length_3946_cov_2.007798_2_plen_175_part_00
MIQDWSSAEAMSKCSIGNEALESPGEAVARQSQVTVGSRSATATHLFNAMIAPLLNTTIAGTIWYQVCTRVFALFSATSCTDFALPSTRVKVMVALLYCTAASSRRWSQTGARSGTKPREAKLQLCFPSASCSWPPSSNQLASAPRQFVGSRQGALQRRQAIQASPHVVGFRMI